MVELNLQLFGGRGSSSGSGGGGAKVTPTSIPDTSVENIQKFVDQFGTGMSVEKLVDKVYTALPNKGGASALGGLTMNKGATIINDRYLSIDGGPTLQFIKQKSQGSWKVKKIGG